MQTLLKEKKKGAAIMGKYYGIDLGMTNICIATVNDGDVEIVKNLEGEFVTPAVIRFEKDGSYRVGQSAKESTLPDGIVVEEILRHIGDTEYCVEIAEEKFSAAELLTLIFWGLKKNAEIQGERMEDVVVTYPPYFGVFERENIVAAVKKAGFNVLGFINYPVAAMLYYLMSRERTVGEKTFLIYDLGGATFEVTLLKVEGREREEGLPEETIEILHVDGNERLGGKDWDRRLAELIIQKASEQTGCSEEEFLENVEFYKEIEIKAENAKKILCRELSENRTVKIVVPTIYGRTRVEITSEEFEDITGDLVGRTIALTDSVLEWLIRDNKRLDEVLLVGGATKMPQVKRALLADEKLSGLMDEVVITQFEPDMVVAKGAALWAQEFRGTEGKFKPETDI